MADTKIEWADKSWNPISRLLDGRLWEEWLQ